MNILFDPTDFPPFAACVGDVIVRRVADHDVVERGNIGFQRFIDLAVKLPFGIIGKIEQARCSAQEGSAKEAGAGEESGYFALQRRGKAKES